MNHAANIGAVVIGRNEGANLQRCLASVASDIADFIYVDSGSTDSSLAVAHRAGARLVELDMSQPFTAARARNAGLAALMAETPVDYVQFIDGDCELSPGWVDVARRYLDGDPDTVVVCGRRRERHPEISVYNRLCDREWDTPVGPARACGGDALMRVVALEAAGGFNPGLIAGEEPELCVRMRANGGQIHRLDHEMTLHDADMTRIGQWWTRARRAGFAYAQGVAMHGGPPERLGVRSTLRAVIWGAAIPLAILLVNVFTPWATVLWLVYPVQVIRLALRGGVRARGVWEQALFLTLGKFPEATGVMEFHWQRIFRRTPTLIEYK